MSKIGHNYEREPYPWDGAEKLNSKEWSCCGMKLPGTFYVCPICEKERDLDALNLTGEDSEED